MIKYKKLIDIMNKINSSISFQHLITTIIESANELLGAEGASLLLLDEETDELIFDIVLSEKGEIITGKRLKTGQGIAGHVAKTGEWVIVNDVSRDERFCVDIDAASGFSTRSIIAVPVMVKDKLIGVLEAVNCTRPGGFEENDLVMLDYIADAAAISINNRELVVNLKNRVDELTCIYEISQSIYFTFDIREFLDRILHAVNKVIRAERCSFVILDESGKNVEYFVSTKGNGFTINLENSLMYHVIQTGDPLLVYNVDEDTSRAPMSGKPRTYGSKSFICVPMKLRDKIIGVLNVTDKHKGDIFDSFDLRVLSTVANQVAETYENVLLQKKGYERERIDKELEIAAEIQHRTFSMVPDNIPGISLGAFAIPSSFVGGDFFEISPFPDDSLGVAVGDVSGKGIPAAIFMNSVRYALRFEIIRHREPTELMGRLNHWVHMDSHSGMFCTFFYAFINREKRAISYASAGHNEQLLYRRESDEFVFLKKRGKPLGVVEGEAYESGRVEYREGDFLVLYTDGLVEQGAEGQMDVNELMSLLRLHRDESAEGIAAHIENLVRHGKPSERIKDDSTLVLVKFV
jgi:serine phosphatase RsbU (regulator of sigma subunit)